MKNIQRLALILGFGLAAACGGESDDPEGGGGGGTVPGALDTGLPDTMPLEDVTPAQYANACEELREGVSNRLGPDKAVSGACEVWGGAFSNTPSDCRDSAETCVQQTENGTHPVFTTEQLDFTTFECGDVGELRGCDVTVREFETCLNDRVALVEEVLADNSCANAASVDLVSAMGLVNLGSMAPPSCARVDSECPTTGPFSMPQ